jgi:hypothetical protein
MTETGTASNEIILYQSGNAVNLEVRLESETVWRTQAQMAELFQTLTPLIIGSLC